MVRISPRRNRLFTPLYTVMAGLLVTILALTSMWNVTTIGCGRTDDSSRHRRTRAKSAFHITPTGTKTSKTTSTTYDSSAACLELPQIAPSGVFFLNHPQKIHHAETIPDVQPSFHFGTMFSNPKRIAYHMSDDIPYFELIRESYQKSWSQQQSSSPYLAVDMGANQGFYTWFLATLGMQVHAFEIQPSNFEALQHGKVFNPKSVADRAHLYPIGLSSTIGRMGQSKAGGSYESHIKQSDEGHILTITLDCWMQHVQPQPLPIQFVKLDVEGFEINVLQGAKQSLLRQKGAVVTWFMEVAPDRWSKASITMDDGIVEMSRMQQELFDYSYVLVRGDSSCPYEVATDKITTPASPPRLLSNNVQMHAIATPQAMKQILINMNERRASCNFWFTNQAP